MRLFSREVTSGLAIGPATASVTRTILSAKERNRGQDCPRYTYRTSAARNDSHDKKKISCTFPLLFPARGHAGQTGASSGQNTESSSQNAAGSGQNAASSSRNAASSSQNAVSSDQNAASSGQNAASSGQHAACPSRNAANSSQNAGNSS